MEPLYISGVVGLIGLMGILALRLRRSPRRDALIEVRGETAVGSHRMVLVEVEGHKLLVSHTQNGLHLLAAFQAPPPSASAPAAAQQPQWRAAPESGEVALPQPIAQQLSSPVEVDAQAAQAYALPAGQTLDFGIRPKGEPTAQFPFEIQQLAAAEPKRG